jgi:hypothetical protein
MRCCCGRGGLIGRNATLARGRGREFEYDHRRDNVCECRASMTRGQAEHAFNRSSAHLQEV